MSSNIEIEFKNLLTKDEYNQLLAYFSINKKQTLTTHKNIYFDTPTKALKQQRSSLRIRMKQNTFELTLKTKNLQHSLEINQKLTENDYLNLLNRNGILKGVVYDELLKLGVNTSQLQVTATLITNRIEFPYEEGSMFLDESFYNQTKDYELEYEAQDYERGLTTFKSFLTAHQIPTRQAEPKVSRAQKKA